MELLCSLILCLRGRFDRTEISAGQFILGGGIRCDNSSACLCLPLPLCVDASCCCIFLIFVILSVSLRVSSSCSKGSVTDLWFIPLTILMTAYSGVLQRFHHETICCSCCLKETISFLCFGKSSEIPQRPQ